MRIIATILFTALLLSGVNFSRAADRDLTANLTLDPLGAGYTQTNNPVLTWQTNDTLWVDSDATLILTNGGQAINQTAKIGAQTWNNGYVIVSGVGSVWSNTVNPFRVATGAGTKGTLRIENGGKFYMSGQHDKLYIGNCNYNPSYPPQSVGWVRVEGTGSVIQINAGIRAGDESSGTLVVTNGGQVIIGNLTSARGGGTNWSCTGQVFVAGSGSEIRCSGYTTTISPIIGASGYGQSLLKISDGGCFTSVSYLVVSDTARATNSLSPLDGSGSVVVEGSNSLLSVGSGTLGLYVGGTDAGTTGGVGKVTLKPGGRIEVKGPMHVYTNSTLEFELGQGFNALHTTTTGRLDNGATIKVALQSGFSPQPRAAYNLIVADNVVTASVADLIFDSSQSGDLRAVLRKTASTIEVYFTCNGTIVSCW